jgi:hypothetical protein
MIRLPPLLLATSHLASAVIEIEPEKRSPMTDMASRYELLLGGGASSDNTGSEFSWEQLTLQGGFGLNKKISDELRIFTGMNYRLTCIDQGEFPMRDELDELHGISVPISAIYHRENSPWTFFAQISGELSTDFKSVTSDDFDFTARLAGQYEFSDRFSLNFGLARSRYFGDAIVLPSIGFAWTPTDDWALTIMGPRLILSHRINDKMILRAGGFPTGGLWNVEEDSGKSVDYGFSTYNAGIGLDYKLRRGIWLSIWAGANFAAEFRAEERGHKLFEDDLDSGFFASVGINIYEW